MGITNGALIQISNILLILSSDKNVNKVAAREKLMSRAFHGIRYLTSITLNTRYKSTYMSSTRVAITDFTHVKIYIFHIYNFVTAVNENIYTNKYTRVALK